MEHLIGWMVTGLILGLFAFAYVGNHGPQYLASSIAGAVFCGFAMRILCGPAEGIDSSGTYAHIVACPCWFMAILGSFLGVGITHAITEDWHEQEPDLL